MSRARGGAWVEAHRGKHRVRVLQSHGGRDRKKTIRSFADVNEANAFVAKWNAAIVRGRIVPIQETTLATFAGEYFDDREVHGSRHRARVRDVKSERSLFRRHIAESELARVPLPKITPEHVDAFVRGLRRREAVSAVTFTVRGERKTKLRRTGRTISRQVQKHALRVVRGMLDEARRQGLLGKGITANPADGVSVAFDAGEARDLSDDWLRADEIETLLRCEELPAVNRRAYACAIGLALRLNDLKAIEVADVHLEAQVPGPFVAVKIAKSGKPHRVPVLPWLAPHIEAQLAALPEGARWLFPTRDGLKYQKHHDFGWSGKRERGERTKARALDVAGVARRVRFHDLRGTSATHLALGSWGRRWSLHEIQSMLAHSDQRVTERYVRRALDWLADAAAATLSGPAAPPAGGAVGGATGGANERTLGDSNPRPTAPEAPRVPSVDAHLRATGGATGGASADLVAQLRAELVARDAQIARLEAALAALTTSSSDTDESDTTSRTRH